MPYPRLGMQQAADGDWLFCADCLAPTPKTPVAADGETEKERAAGASVPDVLEPLGRIVCYGFSSLVTGPKRKLWHAALSLLKAHKVSPITLMNANKGVFGLNLAHLFDQKAKIREGMDGLRERLESGAIRPTIDRTFPLTAEGAAAAHEHLHARRNFGKVVLVRTGV